MRPVGVLMFCLLVGLVFLRVSTASDFLAKSQNSPVAACLLYEPSVVELTGTIIQKSFADGQDRPETYWLLDLSRPICVNEDPKQPDLNGAQKDVREIQLVFLDRKMYATYENLLGKKVLARGTLFAGITVHHHTRVLLTVSNLKMAG